MLTTKAIAQQEKGTIVREVEVRFPKAVAGFVNAQDSLFTLWDVPASHWSPLASDEPG